MPLLRGWVVVAFEAAMFEVTKGEAGRLDEARG